MPTKVLYAAAILGLCAALSGSLRALPQSAQTNGSDKPEPPPPSANTQSGYVLKVTTRLVTLDVIATDSHGKPVRDLKPQEVQVFEEHNSRQEIARLDFVEKAGGLQPNGDFAPPATGTNKVFSNQIAFEQLQIPPTLLLMDGVNTQSSNQMQTRVHLLKLLKTLPPQTPIAILLLGSSLKVLQGFTNDRSLLQSAVDHLLTGTNVQQDPADDLDTLSNQVIAATGVPIDPGTIQDIQDFEKEQYANSMDNRVRETIDALTTIGRYLSGLPGRKNLIWVSESFPISIVPNTDTGSDGFAGIRTYGDQLAAAADTLTDAQVSVYPVNILGLETQQYLSASQTQTSHHFSTGQQIASQISREQNARMQAQGTMEELAKDTGGKTCKNTNDLSGCVLTALNDSSAYYELAFYPQNINWDGRFHKIEVKTSRPGVKLAYRRGYFAVDAPGLAKQQQPEERLREGCSELLPSTAIRLTAQRVSAAETGISPRALQYLLRISASGLTAIQTGDTRNLNLVSAVCEFSERSNKYQFVRQNLMKPVSEAVFQGWLTNGVPDLVLLTPPADIRRLRFIFLDGSTGLTGAVDMPVLPSEIAQIAEAPAPTPPHGVSPSFLEVPDRGQSPVPPKEMGSLSFRVPAGPAGSLDWNSGSLTVRGDLPIDQIAAALFSYSFSARFRCQSGALRPIDPASGEPALRFIFHDRDGRTAAVDLKGEHPEYVGDLPVDASAKSLFDEVWKYSHCQNP